MSWMVPPACVFCEHYHHERNARTDELPSCDAFVEIPEEIFFGVHDHSDAFPGDRGVRFSVSEESREDFLDLNEMREHLGLSPYRLPLKVVHSVARPRAQGRMPWPRPVLKLHVSRRTG